MKRNSTISYDINTTKGVPKTTNNNQTKKKHQRERTREAMGEVVDRSTADKVAGANNLSALLDKNNKSELVNTKTIISDSNTTKKLTSIHMLE